MLIPFPYLVEIRYYQQRQWCKVTTVTDLKVDVLSVALRSYELFILDDNFRQVGIK